MIKPKNYISLKERVLKLRDSGYNVSEISSKMDLPRSTVWDWCTDRKRTETNYPVAYKNENLTFQKEKSDNNNFNIEEFLTQLSPIDINSNFKKCTSKKDHSDYVIVLNDLHFPMQCEKSLEIAFATIEELQPKSIVINGDSLDMLAISRYPKDIRTSFNLLNERIEYHKFLDTLIGISNGAQIVEIHGNHSGDSTAGRWWRYLSERIGELGCLPEIKDTLSYENIFLGKYQEHVSMADYVELTDDLVVLHGDVVRKHGGQSARGTLEKYYQSTIMGHTHRVGFTAQRIPAIGKRKDKQIYGYELGCLCNLYPLYGSSPNWQNAFGIVSIGDDNSFGIETVLINNGVANIATLGKTISI